MIGKHCETFKLIFKEDWFTNGSILDTPGIKLEVISSPRRKWWHLLLQYLTFGWFRASWTYRVREIKN